MSVSRRRVRAIFRKELREYRRNRTIVTGMAILPLIFLVQPLLRESLAAGDVAVLRCCVRHEAPECREG